MPNASQGPDPIAALPGHGQTATLARDVSENWQDATPWPMGPFSRASLRGVVAALCPSPETGAADTPALASVLTPVCLGVRLTLRYMERPLALGLHVGLVLLDWSPVWRLQGLRPLHWLSPAKAAAAVDSAAASRIGLLRNVVMGARAAVLMQWYDLPEVHALMNYDPVSHMLERIALRQRLLAGGEVTEADYLHPLVAELPSPPDLESGVQP